MEKELSYARTDEAATNSGTADVAALTCRTDELKKIKDQIISNNPSDLKIVSIVGMGGIGKTFLAKTIYDDVQISFHFHLRGWITISQNYILKNVLLDLLRSMNIVTKSTMESEEETLYRNLKGRRFLIVLDDVWDAKSWNDFKRIFPNDNNGSRIILTSRLEEVVSFAADPNSCPSHSLNCLSNEESWRLLHTQVFAGIPCPSDLVEISEEIAKKCLGLPLAVVVVAGYLSQIEKKRDCWEEVAETLDSLIRRNEEKILDILCLSYNHLSQQLKACFLYMGIFPKSSDIEVVKLIRFWTAVGFLQTENEALRCLEGLISRNLVMVGRKKYDGTAKTCQIHDLLWDLILREAKKEGHSIFSSLSLGHYHASTSNYDDMMYLMDLTSSYRYLGDSFHIDFPYTYSCNCFRTLRVLDIKFQGFTTFPEMITTFPEMVTSLVGLRYLELSCSNIPESLSRICNLETLKIWWTEFDGYLLLPSGIWLLRRLRHLQVKTLPIYGIFNIDLCAVLDNSHISPFHEGTAPILPDLQTLSSVCFGSLPDQLFSRIPNVKRLKICEIDCEEENNEKLFKFLSDLVHSCELEKLTLYFSKQFHLQQQQVFLSHFIPQGIKQLTLKGCKLQWKEMNILAMLPNIEVLKLKTDSFTGPIYEQDVEGFPKLKVLLFESLKLEQWIAETFHYPVLQLLVFIECPDLQEIPPCFGEMTTLESIELGSCSSSAEESVRIIQQEQQSLGNYDIRVRFYETARKAAERELQDMHNFFDTIYPLESAEFLESAINDPDGDFADHPSASS